MDRHCYPCMYDMELCDTVLFCPNDSAAAGFDFKGGSYVGTFMANMTSTVINIPIVADLNSEEGTEYFLVHLSVHPLASDLEGIVVTPGNIREATVYIYDEILISFQKKEVQVKEGENLILTVYANTPSDQNFAITVNITSSDAHMSCKLMYLNDCDLVEKA